MKKTLVALALLSTIGSVQAAESVDFVADVPVVCGIAMDKADGTIVFKDQDMNDNAAFTTESNDIGGLVSVKYIMGQEYMDTADGSEVEVRLRDKTHGRWVEGKTRHYAANKEIVLGMRVPIEEYKVIAGSYDIDVTLELSCDATQASF